MFPELNHNELVGWENPGLTKQIELFVLRDEKEETDRMRTRIEVTEEIIRPQVAEIIDSVAEGDSIMERMFSLIHLGDYPAIISPCSTRWIPCL